MLLLFKNRRGTICYPTLSSLASEDFPEAARFLFREGFEARIKTQSELQKACYSSNESTIKRTTEAAPPSSENVRTAGVLLMPPPNNKKQQLPVSRVIQGPSKQFRAYKLIQQTPSNQNGFVPFSFHVNHLKLISIDPSV